MGIINTLPNLDSFLNSKFVYPRDTFPQTKKIVVAWQFKSDTTHINIMKWPFDVFSDQAYILLTVIHTHVAPRIPKEQMLSHGMEDLVFMLTYNGLEPGYHRKILIGPYELQIQVIVGDNIAAPLQTKAILAAQQLERYLVRGGVHVAKRIYNQPATILQGEVDFESVLQKLGNEREKIIEKIKKIRALYEYIFGQQYQLKSIPMDRMKQLFEKYNKNSLGNQKDLNMSIQDPFACEITQINVEKQRINEQSMMHIDDQINAKQIDKLIQMEDYIIYITSYTNSRFYNTIVSNSIQLLINTQPLQQYNYYGQQLQYWRLYTQQYLVPPIYELIQTIKNKSYYHILLIYNNINKAVAITIVLLILITKKAPNDIIPHLIKADNINYNQFLPQINLLHQRITEVTAKFYILLPYSDKYPLTVPFYLNKAKTCNQLQTLDRYSDNIFLYLDKGTAKVMVGKECTFKQKYIEIARKYAPLIYMLQISKFSKKGIVMPQIIVELIEKSFRKPQKLQPIPQCPPIKVQGKFIPENQLPVPLITSQKLTFKYPILRPIWHPKEKDGYYYTIVRNVKEKGADVYCMQGELWIGNQDDREQFLERIISCYLGDISEDRIWIKEEEKDGHDKSSFLVDELAF